jgi:acetylornithine deacetylase/succinyl-diaminopimelate desuccinylase-like protein
MNRKPNKTGVSIYKGVQWNNQRGKWKVRIRVRGKSIHVGYFKSEVNAAQAYNFAAEKYHKEFANYNRT